MSGVYGFAAQKGISDPLVLLNRMLEAIQSPWPVIKKQYTTKEGYAGLGVVHPARVGEVGYFAEDPINKVFCVFDGVIYRDASVHEEGLIEGNGAALLLKRYLESGTEHLCEISGSFNVAWWDGRVGRLVLANDRLGHRPLFFVLRNGVLAFSSMMARVAATGIFSPEIDVEGFADLLSYGYILGERTLLKDVRILPPASFLTYEGGEVRIHRYWYLDNLEPYGRYDERRLDELEDVFKIAVKRSIRPDLTCSIGLTGGLDSRCILAAAANQELSYVTHTGGQPDSTDVMLAKEIATQVGVKHIFELLSPDNLGEWLVPMVLRQGGIVATLHSHPCQTLYSPYPFDAEVSGVGGEFVRGFWVFPADLNVRDLSAVSKLLKRWILSKTTQHLEQLWKPEFLRLGLRAPEEHLDPLIMEYNPKDSPVAALEYLYLHERCRKFLNKATLIVRASREVYFPYLDHQWIEALASIPISERITNRIQVDLIKRLYPELLDIPHAKNLVPLSVPAWRLQTIERYRRIKRRVRRRFGGGVPSHKLDLYYQWSRGEMRSILFEILYNPNAAFRTYLRWETVKTLLDQHFSGEDNWQDLVAALTVFEIAHRLWIDS